MKRSNILPLILLTALFVIVAETVAVAGAPLNFVKDSVDQVLSILRDPSYKGEQGKKLQREKLRGLAEALFNFEDISKRTLGRNLPRFTPDQFQEYQQLYTRLLEDTYLNKIQSYSGEQVVYGEEIMLSDTKAEVRTTIVTASKQIPINYRLTLNNGHWRVYDVQIEGVSLVQNYRSQFDSILQDKKPADLIEQLRAKVAENEKNQT